MTIAPDSTPTLARSIVTVTLARLVVNMTRRFAHPFLPTLARELDVPLASVQNVVAVQGGMGITSPIFGGLAERYGRKRVMAGALVLLIAAATLGAIHPRYGVFAVVMIAFGLAKTLYDPAMQAYLSDRIPYTRRAVALGVTELAWAGGLIAAAPLAGFLLADAGLRAVMIVLALCALGALGALIWLLPPDVPVRGAITGSPVSPLSAWRILRRSPAALGAMAFALLISMGNETFYINYGAWMEASFDLEIGALGIVTIAVAAGEVAGEGIVIAAADRIGKRRMALIGAGLVAVCYALLPVIGATLPLALAGVFLLFLWVEVAIVAAIPIYSELLPDARAVMLAGTIGAASLGRLAGGALGGAVFNASGSFQAIGLLAAGLSLLAFAALWRYVIEREAL